MNKKPGSSRHARPCGLIPAVQFMAAERNKAEYGLFSAGPSCRCLSAAAIAAEAKARRNSMTASFQLLGKQQMLMIKRRLRGWRTPDKKEEDAFGSSVLCTILLCAVKYKMFSCRVCVEKKKTRTPVFRSLWCHKGGCQDVRRGINFSHGLKNAVFWLFHEI